jgi:hypothetical protein
MSNAKEKAKELVEKMMLYSYEKIENEKNTKYIVDNKIKKEYAIQCALIAVDEIIEVLWHTHNEHNLKIYSYYQEVKQEIENYDRNRI